MPCVKIEQQVAVGYFKTINFFTWAPSGEVKR
jgi:hypothetical protein